MKKELSRILIAGTNSGCGKTTFVSGLLTALKRREKDLRAFKCGPDYIDRCTPVAKSNAQPGDLIFFKGTYDTPGISHVGLYVGAGKMLHCGDPIRYVDINTTYWQAHFYAFARPPYQ